MELYTILPFKNQKDYRFSLDRRSDAEHPTVIPMYTTTTPQAPRGHTIRPRAYAIGHKVNSLLSEPSLFACETWLLPQTYVLCMFKNQEEGHGTSTSDRKDGEESERKKQDETLPEAIGTGHPTATGRPTTRRSASPKDNYRRTLQRPDDRQTPDFRHSSATGRSTPSGYPVPTDQRRNVGSLTTSGRPDAREPPDDRNPPDVRCLPACMDSGRGPCTPSLP
jgi:hypothetical protein